MAVKRSRAPASATALRVLLKTAAGDYVARKRRAELAALSWKWATGPLFSIVPFQAERSSGPRARPLRSAPARKRGTFEFGFDADGRLTVMRQHAESRGAAYETFIDWDEGGATAVRYGYDPKYKVPSNAARLFIKDGRPTKYMLQGPRGTVTETYHYQDDRLVRIRLKPPGEAECVYHLKYDAEGLCAIDEGRARIFQRPARGRPRPSLSDLLQAIEQQLYVLTPPAIRKAAERQRSPVWCCALDFDGSLPGSCLPPELSLATVAERDAILHKSRRDGSALVWRAAAFEGLGAAYYEDAKLAAACEQANTILERRDSDVAVCRLLVRLAKRLNELPRSQFGDVAPEFVVYAYDRNGAPKALVTRCITTDQRTRLRRMGLL